MGLWGGVMGQGCGVALWGGAVGWSCGAELWGGVEWGHAVPHGAGNGSGVWSQCWGPPIPIVGFLIPFRVPNPIMGSQSYYWGSQPHYWVPDPILGS